MPESLPSSLNRSELGKWRSAGKQPTKEAETDRFSFLSPTLPLYPLPSLPFSSTFLLISKHLQGFYKPIPTVRRCPQEHADWLRLMQIARKAVHYLFDCEVEMQDAKGKHSCAVLIGMIYFNQISQFWPFDQSDCLFTSSESHFLLFTFCRRKAALSFYSNFVHFTSSLSVKIFLKVC